MYLLFNNANGKEPVPSFLEIIKQFFGLFSSLNYELPLTYINKRKY
jgi:hypothetical protein